MASAGNFTLDDEEDSQVALPVAVPLAEGAPALAPPKPVSTQPEPVPAATVDSVATMALQPRAPPKAFHVDEDLGVRNLAQAVSALQENQKHIEDTEAHLQGLVRLQARLQAAGRLLEQQKLVEVLASGPALGYDAGRPTAALLVYRCCLRWGSFSGASGSHNDSSAAAAAAAAATGAVLDHLAALLLQATDEDVINAKHAAAASTSPSAAAAEGRSSGGGGGSAGGPGERAAAAEATREVAYWLAVTSTLLALVDPHVPLVAARHPSTSSASAAANASAGGSHHHHSTPLAVVAGDARASVARAASAAAAKVQELQKRMGNTFSGMQLLGKNLLMRRKSATAAAAAAAAASAAAAPGGVAGPAGGASGGRESESGGQALQRHGSSEEGALPEAQTGAEDGSTAQPHPAAPAPPNDPTPAPAPPPARQPSSPPPAPASLAPTSSGPVGPCPSPSPSQYFRQQLDVLLQRTYNQMRDTLKRHVSAVLPDCVQQQPAGVASPRSPASAAGLEGGRSISRSGGGAAEGGEVAAGVSEHLPAAGSPEPGSPTFPGAPGAPSLQPWLDLIAVLSYHLDLMRAAHVPRIVVSCLFKQTLAFVDVQLFNQLLLRPECCCTSNARYLAAGVQLLDRWLVAPVPAVSAAGGAAGPAALPVPVPASGPVGDDLAVLVEDLRHIRQAAHFLALANKGALRLDDFTAMCPALNVQQLYRLATTFWDDCPPPPPPPPPPAAAEPAEPVPVEVQPPTAAEAPAAEAADGESSGVKDGERPAAEPTDGLPAAGAEGDGAAVQEVAGSASQEDAGTVEDGGKERTETETEAVPTEAQEGAETEEEAGAGNPVMEAAAAAVAAAAAAAAADEAADAAAAGAVGPKAPGVAEDAAATAAAAAVAAAAAAAAVARYVSGEVLEEMKRRHAVANNGGLIVTFLLDEDSAALIAPIGGVVARRLLQIINEPMLHTPLAEGLPAPLRAPDCPAQVFAFLLGAEGAEAAAVPAV